MSVWSEPAPAKINLSLHVVGQRENGYHELEGLTVFTQLCDELTIREAKVDRLHTIGPFAKALADERANIVLKALDGFRAAWPNTIPDGVDITLNKMLPVAAGIGGGSADAAAALRIAAKMAGANIATDQLADLALELGADVPMCLFSRSCLVRGVGEKVQILEPFPKLQLVLANPGIGVPTAKIFRALKSKNNAPLPNLPSEMSHSAALGLWLQDTRNDLEIPATSVEPKIGQLTREMAKLSGCIISRMSGSGATVFGVFGAERQALMAAQQLRAQFPHYWIAQTPII
ncbi:4-(cytidine 5'-diphospho)-2-C-methyl-D-erythritol kinase [Maritalea sp.]|uniref:4-(cytidine 5'-diphospho)-2-C-methyl-D-erythritol kinase n=1 Tax=Maritalea sp. TaxID=2003361 RepID=UPI003EF5DC24